MALIACKECKTEISSSAAACPKCGQPNPKAKHLSGSQVFFALLMVFAAIWWFGGGGFDSHVTQQVNKIENQVASDSVAQYQIAKREGDQMQTCVHAGIVAAAYLQAKDESNYQQWKQTEKSDCRKAGVPR